MMQQPAIVAFIFYSFMHIIHHASQYFSVTVHSIKIQTTTKIVTMISITSSIVVLAFVFMTICSYSSAFTIAATSSKSRSTTELYSSSTTTPSAVTIPPIPHTDPNHPLIQIANEYIYTKSGFYSPHDPDSFSNEFIFRGPYIGPLNKADYLATMDTFGIYKAIPDINPNAFGFSIDPLDPNRVWFMVRNTGTFTGEPGLGFGNEVYVPPNGKSIQGCPETFSITFDDQQKVKHLTVGYVADRFQGNTNGKGAAVGIFNSIGIPFPEPGPLLKFIQWFGTEVYNTGASSYSTKDIPAWWTSEEKASQGY
jgi:hypothetical protein